MYGNAATSARQYHPLSLLLGNIDSHELVAKLFIEANAELRVPLFNDQKKFASRFVIRQTNEELAEHYECVRPGDFDFESLHRFSPIVGRPNDQAGYMYDTHLGYMSNALSCRGNSAVDRGLKKAKVCRLKSEEVSMIFVAALKQYFVITIVVIGPGIRPVTYEKPLPPETTHTQCVEAAFKQHGEKMSRFPGAIEIKSRCEER